MNNAKEKNKGSRRTKYPNKCLKCGIKYRTKHPQESCDNYMKLKKNRYRPKVPCELCGKSYTNKKTHMERWHTPQQERTYYNCDQCAYRSLNKQTLTRHMKNHEGVVLETCHVCGRKFKDLKGHILRHHSSEANYGNIMVKCEICGKDMRKIALYTHRRTMHMERKWACHLCSYKAQTNYNLKLHISKSHLGVKELEKEQCPHCDVITTNLPHHLKIYHP